MTKEKKLTFSIDRLTIIGSLIHERCFQSIYFDLRNLEYVYQCNNIDSAMFEFSYNIDGLGFVQIDNPTKKIRIDFNPNIFFISLSLVKLAVKSSNSKHLR